MKVERIFKDSTTSVEILMNALVLHEVEKTISEYYHCNQVNANTPFKEKENVL